MSAVRQSPARVWSMKRIRSDTELIKSIQRHRTPLRDRFFRFAALLGDEPAFTTGLPVLGWSIAPEVCLLVILSWMVTFYVGHALKDYFQLPRPFLVDKDVVCLEDHFSAEFGMPSTHAQAVWAIPPTVLLSQPPSALLFWALVAVAYAGVVSFSRLYLGVHSLLDVLAGASLGIATCAAVLVAGPAVRDAYLATWPPLAMLIAFAVHVSLAVFYPRLPGVSTTYRDTCSILGVSLGVWWSARLLPLYSGLHLASSVWLWLARVAVGLAVVLVGHLLFKRLVRAVLQRAYRLAYGPLPRELDSHMPFLAVLKFVSYIGIGFNSLTIAPLAFSHFNL